MNEPRNPFNVSATGYELSAGDLSMYTGLADPNPSGLEPLGRAVLVTPYEPERKRSAIVLPPSVLQNERTLDTKVRVVAIGPGSWPDEPARCSVGDIVFIAKFSGFVAQGPKDGQPYRFVNDRDIFARVTHFEGEGA